jgi:hypothetical protein
VSNYEVRTRSGSREFITASGWQLDHVTRRLTLYDTNGGVVRAFERNEWAALYINTALAENPTT